ncbi:MAG: hypothetical protein WAU82_01750 [Candidatus Binatus sp.]|uniref:hypothetical protein n=1 Tax=Candidatus Binatus sp. TaxID=2811406 RepID=UPI003BB1CB13
MPPFLTVKRETDLVALAAFVLAFTAVAYQVAEYFRGAQVKLFGPEQILIHGDNIDGQDYVRFAARMSFINSGDIGYNAIIGRESLQVQIGGTPYAQTWQSFIHSGSPDGTTLSLGDVEEAVPTPIDGGDATTHETYFAPWPIDCKGVIGSNCNPTANFMTWDSFLKSIKSGDVLKFNLIADIYGKNPQTATCTVAINDALIAQLNAPAKWSAPACEEALSSL